MTNRPIRVMCVDDNELVADAIKRRINFEPRFEWAGWVSETSGAADHIREQQPDVVLFDIDMPGRDAFEVVRDLAEHWPGSRSVMFSGYVRSDYIDRAVESGAWGYVSKNASIDEVLTAVERVARGEFAFTQEAIVEQRRSAGQSSSRRNEFDNLQPKPT